MYDSRDIAAAAMPAPFCRWDWDRELARLAGAPIVDPLGYLDSKRNVLRMARAAAVVGLDAVIAHDREFGRASAIHLHQRRIDMCDRALAMYGK